MNFINLNLKILNNDMLLLKPNYQTRYLKWFLEFINYASVFKINNANLLIMNEITSVHHIDVIINYNN